MFIHSNKGTAPMKSLSNSLIKLANSMQSVVVLYVVSVLLFAGIFSSLEEITFFKSVYFGIVTSFTIGYGDIVPKHGLSILITSVFILFWNMMIIPLIIVNILFKVIKDNDKFTDAEQQEMFNTLKDIKNTLEDIKNPRYIVNDQPNQHH
jgi:voltage-gated potassium channel